MVVAYVTTTSSAAATDHPRCYHKVPSSSAPFFKHLQHDLSPSHPLAMCSMPSCGEGCKCPRRLLISNGFRSHDCGTPIQYGCGIPTCIFGEPVYTSQLCNSCYEKKPSATSAPESTTWGGGQPSTAMPAAVVSPMRSRSGRS